MIFQKKGLDIVDLNLNDGRELDSKEMNKRGLRQNNLIKKMK